MAKYPCLMRRNDIFYVRKRVPQDISDMFKAKEIKRSLKTQNRNEAIALYHQALSAIESKFETARLKKQDPHAHDLLSTYDERGILGLVYDWYIETNNRLQRIESTSTNVYNDEDIQNALMENQMELDRTIQAMNKNDYSLVKHSARKWLKERDITYNPESPAYKQFCYYLIRTDIFLQKKSMAEMRGKTLAGIPDFFTNITANHQPFLKPASNGFQPSKVITITQLAERYINSDEKAHIESKSKEPYRVLARRMKEFFGRDMPIHEIDREMLEEFRGALLKLPKHAEKKYPGTTILQAIKQADKENNQAHLSITTVNNQMMHLSALMGYAEKQTGWIDRNPARGMALPNTTKKKARRNPFSIDQLNIIFKAPLYTGCVNDERGYSKPGNNHPRRGRFWIPLICLYSGLRLNEACQLEVGDIEKVEGIHILSVRDEGETGAKKTKTQTSIRPVPIHNELKAIGFLEFVQAQKAAGEIWLFPELPEGAHGYKSHGFTKWFGRFIRKLGVYTPKTTFHSFRHNIRDALRNAEAPKEISDALGGWDSDQSVSSNYGKGHSMEILDKYLQKTEYKGLDLSHLKK